MFYGQASSSINKHAIANFIEGHVNGKQVCVEKYARLVISRDKANVELKEEGGLRPKNKPGTWLVDIRASNNYKLLKHFFIHLVPCISPIVIVVGNEWIEFYYYRTISLIIEVWSDIYYISLEYVSYVSSL